MSQIQEMFQAFDNMQWQDYLDILLVAFLIYKMIPIFKATGTTRIAVIIAVILGAALVTDAMKLHTLNFLINQVTAVGLVAVVVLFQPELRRVLDQMGKMKIKGLFVTEKVQQEMEPLIFPQKGEKRKLEPDVLCYFIFENII